MAAERVITHEEGEKLAKVWVSITLKGSSDAHFTQVDMIL